MKINDRALTYFANCTGRCDKEGWLWKKGEVNTSYQKRWCMLFGNLLYYYDKRFDKEPVGVIVLENCSIQLAEGGDSPYTFSVVFMGHGMRTYKFVADDEDSCNSWIKALSLCSYKYLKILVEELEKSAQDSAQESILLIPESQKPTIKRGMRSAGSMEDLLKVKGRVTTRKTAGHTGTHSEKSLANYIDFDEDPLKVSSIDQDGSKIKTVYYPLKESSCETLLKVEYSGKSKAKNQLFITTDKCDVPTSSKAARSFHVLHEYFRQCIEDTLSSE